MTFCELKNLIDLLSQSSDLRNQVVQISEANLPLKETRKALFEIRVDGCTTDICAQIFCIWNSVRKVIPLIESG